MEEKKELVIDKNIIAKNRLRKTLSFFSYHKEKKGIFLIMIFVVLYSVYIWYVFVYNPDWSEDKKQEYIKSKMEGADFDRKEFEKIIEESVRRNQEFQKKVEISTDIFRLKE